MGVSSKPRMEVLIYEGNLNVESLIDSISPMDTYFDYGNVDQDKRVKFVVTTLRGH